LRFPIFVVGTGRRDGSDASADVRSVLQRRQPAAVVDACRPHGPHPAPVEFRLYGKPLGAEFFGRPLTECVDDQIARTLRGTAIAVSDAHATDPATTVRTRNARTVDSLVDDRLNRIPLRRRSLAI
jgi:hypothetical protein